MEGAVNQFCCEDMATHVGHVCDLHPDPFDCPDNLIWRSEEGDSYGIIYHDGGSSFNVIAFCPWCGKKLPKLIDEDEEDQASDIP